MARVQPASNVVHFHRVIDFAELVKLAFRHRLPHDADHGAILPRFDRIRKKRHARAPLAFKECGSGPSGAPSPCYGCEVENDALQRRAQRLATWASKAFSGADVHRELEDEALEEWAAMDPLDRLALTWQLSLEQFGGRDGSVEPRLPRSAYRLERR